MHASSPLLFFSLKGEKPFSTLFSLMGGEKRKEHNLGQSIAIYLLEPGRGGQIFCEHSSAWVGVLIFKPSSPPSPFLVFFPFSFLLSLFFLFFLRYPPPPSPHDTTLNELVWGVGNGAGRIHGGRWNGDHLCQAGASSLSTYLKLSNDLGDI